VLFLSTVQQATVGHGHLIIEESRSHSDTQHSVGLLWTSDLPDNTQHSQQTDIQAPGGIQSQIPAIERSKTYASDRAATEKGSCIVIMINIYGV